MVSRECSHKYLDGFEQSHEIVDSPHMIFHEHFLLVLVFDCVVYGVSLESGVMRDQRGLELFEIADSHEYY